MTVSIICGFLPSFFLSPFAGVWADPKYACFWAIIGHNKHRMDVNGYWNYYDITKLFLNKK